MGAEADSRKTYGGITLDAKTHEVTIEEKKYVLSVRMFSVLALLFQHMGKGVGAETIKRQVWPESVFPWNKTSDLSNEFLEALVADLKKKLGQHSDLIIIQPGGDGYLMDERYLKRLHGLLPARRPLSYADFLENYYIKNCPFCRIQWGKHADQIITCPHCGLRPGPAPDAGYEALTQWADEVNDQIESLWSMGCRELALRYWKIALSYHSDHLATAFNLGYALWREGHWRAEKLVNKMRELEKKYGRNPIYWRCLAWIHLMQGNGKELETLQVSPNRVCDEQLLQALADKNRPSFNLHCHIQRNPGEMERTYVASQDGRQCITFASDGSGFELWNMVEGKTIRCGAETGGAITSAAFSSDGCFILTGSQNGMIRLWSKFGQEVGLFHQHAGLIEALRFLPDDNSFISVAGDGAVRRWWLEPVRESRLLAQFRLGVDCLAVSTDGRGLFVMGDRIINKTRIVAYDLETDQIFWTFEGPAKNPSAWEQSDSFAFALDRRVVVGRSCMNNNVCTWNFYNGDGPGELDHDDEELTHMQVIPGNDWYLVTATSCRSPEDEPISNLRIWNVGRSRLITKENTLQDRITAVGLDEGGDFVASGGHNGSIILWRLADGRRMRSFTGHVGKVFSIGLSPDGRFMLSYGEDCAIRLWEVESGCNLSQFSIPASEAIEGGSIGFTWDSRYVYYIGSDVWLFKLNYPVREWEGIIPHPLAGAIES